MAQPEQERAPTGTGGSIWLFAFGYLASYVPYSALTKALTGGVGPGEGLSLAGASVLPLSSVASLVGMLVTLSLLGWWRYAPRRFGVPFPGPWTFLSGVATAVILLTTTFAYTIPGASIVLMMVLMRGGVLVLAPVVDALGGRRVRWFSWVALAFSGTALVDLLTEVTTLALPPVAWVDIGLYLAAYFARLRFMTRLAKGSPEANRRFFVEEQLVATPVAVLACAVMALALPTRLGEDLATGWALVRDGGPWAWVLLVGVLSQFVGMFGGLVFLDARENSFCVPVNRASSVIAGVLAAGVLAVLYAKDPPSQNELGGAATMVLATLVLGFGPRLEEAWRARFAPAPR